MGRLTLTALIVFNTVALHAVSMASAQDTPFGGELASIDESNRRVKQDVEQAMRDGRTSEEECRAFAIRLAEMLGPMSWPHELSGPDAAAQTTLEGLVRLANLASELSEQGAKPDELIAINDQVQTLIFQGRFAIRRAERDARLTARLNTRDALAAQAARDQRRQTRAINQSQQRRAAADAAHQRQIEAREAAHRRELERQNAEAARQAQQAQRAQRRRARRSGLLRGVASVAAHSTPRASRPSRGRRVNHRQTTTVSRSNGRTRTTTRYRTTVR